MQDFYNMDFEDNGGMDGLSQDDFLASIINPQPVYQPTPQPVAPTPQPPIADPVAQLFASQPAAYQAPTIPNVPDFLLRPPIVERDPFGANDGIVKETYTPEMDRGLPATTSPLLSLNNGSEPAELKAPDNIVKETYTPEVAKGTPTQLPEKLLADKSLPQNATGIAALAASIPPSSPPPTDALVKQILGQNLTSKWTGEGFGSAEKNAADMAKILAGIGITDIKQFGKIPQYETQAQYKGQQVNVDEDGNTYIMAPGGGSLDDYGNPMPSKQVIDPKQVEQVQVKTGDAYGNKVTGQIVPTTYSERQTGNFWGGTFAGKGNTGYGVQFDAQGNPYFYTQGASSNDVANIMKDLGPVGQIAAAYFGGPAAVAAIAAASGKPIGDIIKSAALSYLGGAAGNAVSGIEGITDALGQTGTDIVSNAAKQFVGSGGKVDPVAALLAGGVNAGVNSLLPSVGLDDLTSAQKNILSSGVMGLVNGQPLDKVLMNAAIGALTSGGGKEPQTVNQQPPDDDEFIKSLEQYKQPTEPTNPQTVTQQPVGVDELLNQLQQYKQPSIDELLASIEPKTAEQPAASPSNEEILKQIGYEPEPEPKDSYGVPEPLPKLATPSNSELEPVAANEPEPVDFEKPNPVVEPDTNPKTSEDIIRDLQDAGLTDQEIGLPEPTAPDENVFDPTFGGVLPLEEPAPPSVDEEPQYLNTDEDFVPTNQMEEPEPDYLNTDEDFVPTDEIEEPQVDEEGTDEEKSKINASAAKAKKTVGTNAAAVAKAKAAAAAKAQADAAAKARANAIAQQNYQLEALLNMMGSNNDVAHIKSYKELFGEDLTQPSAPAESEVSAGEEQLFRGGHINNISVDDLLQILRG
jgi:hypothetical protein